MRFDGGEVDVGLFGEIRGNSRACLISEPFFVLPYSMYVTYMPVYMLMLGVTEQQIGWVTTLGLALQIVTSMIGGYVTDRMGRRMALLVFELVSWTVAAVFWLLADHVWFFAAAAVFNSFKMITYAAWNCLIVEDSDPRHRPKLFTIIQLIGVAGGLLSPLGGLLVSRWSLVPGVRAILVITLVSMTLMFIGRYFATYETDIGLRKQKEAGRLRLGALPAEYAGVFRTVWANQALLLLFCVHILFHLQLAVKNAFLSVYLVKYLRFDDAFISVFPAVTSVVMLVVMFGLLPRVNKVKPETYMISGFLISAAGVALQIAIAPEQYGWMMFSAFLSAVGTVLAIPFLEAAVANTMEDDRRAGMLSVLSVFRLICIAPAGVLGGWSFALDPRAPFLLIVLSFLAGSAMLIVYRRLHLREVSGAI